MSNLLKKLEGKANRASMEHDIANTHGILTEIKSTVQNLSSIIYDRDSNSERILTIENLLVKMYDAIENSYSKDSKNDELIELQKSLSLSNEIVISLLKRIIEDEHRQSLLVQSIGDTQRTTSEMCGMIEQSIASAMLRDTKTDVVQQNLVPAEFKFHVIRDEHGDMSDVILTRH